MVDKKIKIGVLFGGQSVEHEISLLSAKNIMAVMDKQKYDILPIGIDKQGTWHLYDDIDFCMTNVEDPKKIRLETGGQEVLLKNSGFLIAFGGSKTIFEVDLFFPILHGTSGEDGTLQGMLQMMRVPFVGANAMSSAICMDKEVTKRLFLQADIVTAEFLVFYNIYQQDIDFKDVKSKLGLPVFVKPANLGSSIGISKVRDEKEFLTAVKLAFQYNKKIIVEEFIDGMEIEVSILGNENLKSSLPGRLILKHDFYSYDAKYLDDNAAELEIPAKLDSKLIKKIQDTAIKAYKTLECEGMARVDFFITNEDNKIYVNEINTIPGFTKISMYPKLWKSSGLEYKDLIDELINLALKRFNRDKSLTKF